MNLRRAVTPFLRGLFFRKGRLGNSSGSRRDTTGSWCEFYPYKFPECSEKVEEKYGALFKHFHRTAYLIELATEKVCPAIVSVSPEKGLGGSGIIIDSAGTVLTLDCNVFSLNSRSKIIVRLHDRRHFSGTILEVSKNHGLALLKIHSKSPVPSTMLGSLEKCKDGELISFETLFRRRAYPRPSSQNEVHEEGNLMLLHEEFIPNIGFENFYRGHCGGPIVNLDGEVVGISTLIHMIRPLDYNGYHGIIKAMGIAEALCNVGYIEHGSLE